jgi:hypothetical protein
VSWAWEESWEIWGSRVPSVARGHAWEASLRFGWCEMWFSGSR